MGTTENVELTARLTRIYDVLAQAHDTRSFVRAVGDAVAPFGPQNIDLAYVEVDASGRPTIIEVVESWQSGSLLATSPIVGRFPVADSQLSRLLLSGFDEPQFIPNIDGEPDLAHILSAVGRRSTSAALLPLFSQRQGTWQGVLGLCWNTRHEADAGERAMYSLLMRLLADAIANNRTQRALRDSLQANERLLQHVEATLLETETQKATLRAMLDNLPLGVAVVHGETGERELVNRVGVRLLGEHGESAKEIGATQPFVYFPGEPTPVPPEMLPHVRTLATGETHRAELEFEFHTGRRALLEVTTSLLRYPGDPAARVILIYQDITDARRRESERLRVQDELLTAQKLALAERSTPLLPIRDDVLVMPLVGDIDAERGRQITATLVDLAGVTHVRAAIIDVTGVRELDALAASTLIGAAKALRLRGVRPILTGIQPVVAAAIVGLGIDLGGITVCGTLQDAVSHASGDRAPLQKFGHARLL